MGRALRFTKCNLRLLMTAQGMTFKVLAEQIGVSYPQIQKYANGSNEMSLKVLLEACKALNCKPIDIYPEIEMYDKGFDVPKSQKQSQDDGENNTTESNSTNVTNVNNHYYQSNFIRDFFGNVRLLDINSKGALLFKIAVFVIAINYLLYLGFRMFGYPYSPLGGSDHLSQLIWAWMVFTWPMGFVIPLVVKHWLAYVLTLSAFRGIVGVTYNYFNVGFMHNGTNQIDPQALWLIQSVVALALTLIYAFIVKKYLRGNSSKIKTT